MAFVNSHGITVTVTATVDKVGHTGALPDFTNIYDVTPPSGGFTNVNITAHDDTRPRFKAAKMNSDFPTMSITTDYDATAIECNGTECTIQIVTVDDDGTVDDITFNAVCTGADQDGSFAAGDSEFRRSVVNFDIVEPATPNLTLTP